MTAVLDVGIASFEVPTEEVPTERHRDCLEIAKESLAAHGLVDLDLVDLSSWS